MKILIIFLLVCLLVYYFVRRHAGSSDNLLDTPIERKTVAGVLPFGDVVGWFKTLPGLDPETDTPFMLKAGDAEILRTKFHVNLNLELTPGKESLLLGVYNSHEDKVTHSLLVEADSLDQATITHFGNESFIVLS